MVIDAGMNDLIRPALYDACHPLLPLYNDNAAPKHQVDVVGPICESSDLFARHIELPVMQAGDLIALGTAGAYGAVMRSGYNARALAAEVVAEGTHWAITTPVLSPDQQLRQECLAPWI